MSPFIIHKYVRCLPVGGRKAKVGLDLYGVAFAYEYQMSLPR